MTPSTPRRLKSTIRAAAVAALLPVVAVACGVNPQPTDYGEDYENHFMLGCTGIFQEGDRAGERDENAAVYAPEDTCQCMYDGYVEKVPFNEVKEFEEEQAEADSGDEIEIPDNIQSVIDDCDAEA